MGEATIVRATVSPTNAAIDAGPAKAFGSAPPEDRLAHMDFTRGRAPCDVVGVYDPVAPLMIPWVRVSAGWRLPAAGPSGEKRGSTAGRRPSW